MASNSSDQSAPLPTPQQQQARFGLFNYIRRFTDHHIASVLHSLIGLPTMLPPSSTHAWITDDDAAQSPEPPSPSSSIPTSQPHPTSATSSPILTAAAAASASASSSLKKDADTDTPQSTRGRIAECFLLTDPRSPVLFKTDEEAQLAASIWRQLSLLHRDFTAPFFGGDVFGTGMRRKSWVELGGQEQEHQREEEEVTELDAYNHLAPSVPRPVSVSAAIARRPGAGGREKLRVVSEIATTHSWTGPDGVARVRYVLKKRFADGSEEKVEEERTTTKSGPA